MASEHGDEYEEPVAEELLTERLDDDAMRTPLLHVDSIDDRMKPRYNDIIGGDDEVCEEEDGSESLPQGCWDTPLASKMALPSPPHNEPQRRRKLENTKEQQQIQSLTRKLSQYKKLNAELHHQLQAFYKNEAVAQLENRNREKQLHIDQLLYENRMLSHQQRLLAKQIEELQKTKATSPIKKYTLQEELRIYKERLRQYKQIQKDVDDKASKTHQQAVDLAAKNKVLVESVKKLEAAASVAALSQSASSAYLPVSSSRISSGRNSSALFDTESIIASQEDEITRLQQRIALMKKTRRADKVKHERQLKANHEEIEQTKSQLEAFYQQLFAKEKTIRSLFLQMKKLKRTVQDLSNAQQTNQQMQQMVFGQEVRFTNHSPNYQHQRYSANHHQFGPLSHASLSSTQSLPFAGSKKAAIERIHITLRQLGYIPSFTTSGKSFEMPKSEFGGESQMEIGGNGVTAQDEEDGGDEEELPPNVVQGKLIPCPPPASVTRNAVRNGTPTSRNQFYSPSVRENSRGTLETALDNERSGDEDEDSGQDGGRKEAHLDDFGTRGFEESDLEDDVEEQEREEVRSQVEENEIGQSEDDQDPGVPPDAEDDD